MECKLKVLIADNSTELGQLSSKVLTSYGMEVFLCDKDGKVVLEKIKSLKPDVVLADVFMPNLDILGVISGIKESKGV